MRAAITSLQGVEAVTYAPHADRFTVSYDPKKTGLEDIFAAVYLAGRQAGQDYLPQVIS